MKYPHAFDLMEDDFDDSDLVPNREALEEIRTFFTHRPFARPHDLLYNAIRERNWPSISAPVKTALYWYVRGWLNARG